VLVGLPGAGKSTAGRLLATMVGTDFIDFDVEIERRVGLAVVDIFSKQGESAFRRLERELTAELRGAPGAVIAPGGGWILDPANVDLLRPPSRIVHLRVSPDVAVSRLGDGVATRPLLMKGDPQQNLALLEWQRMPMYASADAEVDTQMLTPQTVALELRELASRWGWPVG
jgi:shikimate kinase